jgi:hypothetical protein
MGLMRAKVAAVLVFLGSCGGDGFDEDTTCGVAVAVSGGLEAAIAASENPACLTQVSFGDGVDVVYLLPDHALPRVELRADTIRRGETAVAQPAQVRLEAASGEVWVDDTCTIDVTSNAFERAVELGDQYRVAGTVTCPAPLPPATGDAAAVMVDAMEVVVVVTFNP